MQVLRTFARVYTSDLDATLATYAAAGIGAVQDRRFAIPEARLEVSVVGDTVIVAGDDDALSPFRATETTWVVDDLDDALHTLAPRTMVMIRAPRDVPTGRNATVKLQGVQVELVQWN